VGVADLNLKCSARLHPLGSAFVWPVPLSSERAGLFIAPPHAASRSPQKSLVYITDPSLAAQLKRNERVGLNVGPHTLWFFSSL
jgi:hypothetical protein